MTARYRERYMAPFANGASLNINRACFDKLSITIKGAHVVFNSHEEYNGFINTLGNSEFLTRGFGSRRHIFDFDDSSLLFTGSLKLQNVPRSPLHKNIQLRLKLNPSRFIADHATRDVEGYAEFDTNNVSSMSLEQIMRRQNRAVVRQTLDHSDNYLDAFLFRQKHQFEEITWLYLEKVILFISQQLMIAANNMISLDQFNIEELTELPEDEILHGAAHFYPRWSEVVISYGEVYYEFSDENAVATIRSLREALLPSFNTVSYTEYPLFDNASIEEHRRFNCPCIKIVHRGDRQNAENSTNDVEICIYAKTINRLRFEVRYKHNLRTLLNDLIRNDTETELRGVETIRVILRCAKQDAHTRSSRVLEQISDLDLPKAGQLQKTIEFLEKFSRLLNSKDALHRMPEILSVLMTSGGYTLRANSEDRLLFDALERHGLIERSKGYSRMSNGLKRYVLHPEYLQFMYLHTNQLN